MSTSLHRIQPFLLLSCKYQLLTLLLIYCPYRLLKQYVLMLLNDLNLFLRCTKQLSKGRKEVKLEPGDLVWLHLQKERFSDLRKSKLMSHADGPFKILEKINNNTYKLELTPEFGVSPIFNILDLRPYLGEEDEILSRTTSIQVERMMRTSLHQIQLFLLLSCKDQLRDHEHNNYVVTCGTSRRCWRAKETCTTWWKSKLIQNPGD
jgi:hypothetical protein